MTAKSYWLVEIQRYANRLMFWDFFVSAASLLFIWNIDKSSLSGFKLSFQGSQTTFLSVGQEGLIATLIGIYWALFVIYKSNRIDLAGEGIPEYIFMARICFTVLVVLAFTSFLFKADFSRLYIVESTALTMVLLVWHRWMGRQWLLRQRAKKTLMRRTMVLGETKNVLDMLSRMTQNTKYGFLPVIAIVIDSKLDESSAAEFSKYDIEVRVREKYSATLFDEHKVDTCIIASTSSMSSRLLQEFSWGLEGSGVELIVATSLVNFNTSKIKALSVSGMPLFKIQSREFSRFSRILKRTFDLALGSVLLALSIPILVLTAVAIFIEDRGPAFFVQKRVGLLGKHFNIFKMRSMVVDAESRLSEVKSESNPSTNSVMFKHPNDPRITKVGRFIRRWSIDELPQLFNVVIGNMSLVGPRPPLVCEFESYQGYDSRRLLVKPGITGPWQVSGRSALTWEQTIQLDLDYVENWSIWLDLFLLLRTFRAVVSRIGAY